MIAIVDDLFPWRGSGFRFAEYDYYLKHSSSIAVYSNMSSLGFVGAFEEKDRIIAETSYGDKFRVVSNFQDLPKMEGYYCLFLNNVDSVIKLAERDGVPFAFTLYPGGGFELENDEVLEKLKLICQHHLLHKIIVTQPKSFKVLKSVGCPDDKIEYIFGVVSESERPKSRWRNMRPRFNRLAICFAAHKYDSLGRDKGLDLFVQMADRLYVQNSNIDFHVVGPWKSAIDALSKYPAAFTIHEILPIEKLSSFFTKMDIAIFPTRKDINALGRFDGFPTATMVQAALSGCVTISTNPLHQDTPIKANLDYLEIEPDFDSLWQVVQELIAQPSTLRSMSSNAKKHFFENYNIETQMAPRLRILESMPDTEI